ncbi:hypothetical protein [Amycolatopsis sp. 195334CR]|uniref:hypothetical protein n=1 Tax=Amycolatopsis sp. 195334CR TaxID=2814588 RepID=UPI001A8DBE17|nr:hypothetical protein [Amycolatopsis sp. 195334CR]MBN6039464.1 hypothetical protein [Amycolatopsis sp. 195334CR]
MSELVKPIRLTRSGHFPADSGEFTALGFTSTGLPGRIVEFAAVRLRADGTVLGELSTLVGAAPAPTLSEIAGNFVELCRGSVLVTHDLSHETRLLAIELSKAGVPMPMLPGVCTLDAARSALRLPNYRPATVAHALGLDSDGSQTALGSARLCGRILVSLLDRHRLALGEQPRFRRLPIIAPGRPRPRADTAPSVQGWEGDLVERLPSPTGDALERSYAGLLADAFADHQLSPDEAAILTGQASAAGLTGPVLARIHLDFVESMVALAKADGVVTAAEERDLKQLATLLGVPEAVRDLRPTGQPRRILVLGTTPDADALRAAILDAGVQLARKLTASVTHLVHDDGVPPAEPRLGRARELGAKVLPIAEAASLLTTPPLSLDGPTGAKTPAVIPVPRPEVARPKAGRSTVPSPRPVPAPHPRTVPAPRPRTVPTPRPRTVPAPRPQVAGPTPPALRPRPVPATQPPPRRVSHPAPVAPPEIVEAPAAREAAAGTASVGERQVWAGTATMVVGLCLMVVTVVALFSGAGPVFGLLFGAVAVGALLFGWRVHDATHSTVD